jgi:molecular chaperone GrpE
MADSQKPPVAPSASHAPPAPTPPQPPTPAHAVPRPSAAPRRSAAPAEPENVGPDDVKVEAAPASSREPAREASAKEDAPKDPITEAREAAARFKDQWIRTAADFDNFRKRSRRELEDARKAGREDLLRDLLPVFDNLERGMQSAQQAADVKAVVDGLQLILKQFDATLGKAGITRVPTLGRAFDPSIHEAIQQVETSEHAPGTIVAEVQPGYMAGERLIRAAMVVVAKPKSEEPITN